VAGFRRPCAVGADSRSAGRQLRPAHHRGADRGGAGTGRGGTLADLSQVSGQLVASRGNDNTAFVNASSFIAALALSWEIDLWGRYHRATEAARAQLVATEEGRNGVIVSLVAGVAQRYLALNGLHQRLAIVQHTARIQRDSLNLVRLLAEHGVQSATEVRQAETQLLTTENQIPAIELSIAQNEDALATLLGKPPRSFAIGPDLPAGALPPSVPPGIPSQLLERRPDIRQSEQQLVAANANVGVARALFFPTISLTGTLGRASDVLVGLVDRGGVTTHAVGAALGVPIFQGGALVANYDAAVARAEQATEQYRRTIVVALREVSDALADLCFRAGVISYLEVLDAQRQLFSAQLDLNASEVTSGSPSCSSTGRSAEGGTRRVDAAHAAARRARATHGRTRPRARRSP